MDGPRDGRTGSRRTCTALPGEMEADRASIQPGILWTSRCMGSGVCQPYEFTVRDGHGHTLFTSTLLSNSQGTIERTSLWSQIGLDDIGGRERFPVEEAMERYHGQRISIVLSANGKELLRRELMFADRPSRPVVVATDGQGFLQNALIAGRHEAFVTALNLPFKGRAVVYLVPRQQRWRGGRFRSGRARERACGGDRRPGRQAWPNPPPRGRRHRAAARGLRLHRSADSLWI